MSISQRSLQTMSESQKDSYEKAKQIVCNYVNDGYSIQKIEEVIDFTRKIAAELRYECVIHTCQHPINEILDEVTIGWREGE